LPQAEIGIFSDSAEPVMHFKERCKTRQYPCKILVSFQKLEFCPFMLLWI